jgi:hypothetical protein
VLLLLLLFVFRHLLLFVLFLIFLATLVSHAYSFLSDRDLKSITAAYGSIDNANPPTPVSLSVPTANFIDQPMLIAGFTVDVNGNESPDGDQPFREDWIYGEVGAPTGEMKISIPGTLAIGSDRGPAAFYTSTVSLQNGVTCMVRSPTISRTSARRSMRLARR